MKRANHLKFCRVKSHSITAVQPYRLETDGGERGKPDGGVISEPFQEEFYFDVSI